MDIPTRFGSSTDSQDAISEFYSSGMVNMEKFTLP